VPTQRSYTIALIISALLHLLVILAFKTQSKVIDLLFPTPHYVQLEPSQSNLPIFELVALPEQAKESIPTELVETPDDAAVDEPPEHAQFLSDKNTRARDMYTGNDLKKGLPYSEGQTPYKVFAGLGQQGQSFDLVQLPSGDATQAEPQKSANEETKPLLAEDGSTMIPGQNLYLQQSRPKALAQPFSREMLYGSRGSSRAGSGDFSDDLNWNNRESSAEDLGGVSLSTYAWDFAPYIFYMKKHIRNHIYPPPAFYQIGAISGETVLRFRVQVDGSMTDLVLINYTGHKALMETSMNAVKASNPFRPLPKDFPDPYLELTWTFIYATY